jgi:hypothetical protein
MKEGSGNGEFLSMGALSSFTGDPEEYVKEGSEDEHLSLSGGAPLGNLEWALFTGDFERQTKEGSTDEANLVHVRTQHILLHVRAFCIQPYTFVMCVI